MSRFVLNLTVLIFLLTFIPATLNAQTYWPGTHPNWDRRNPEQLGLDPDKIQQAVEIAIAGESDSPRDLSFNHRMTFGREPYGEPVGPFTVRAPQTGLI
ncbi:MAG TPA: serine hydrolase, partial [Gemmatimonadetes bacterium]|nr:serine hydrolase [Gemmatimonadota bacterium]